MRTLVALTVLIGVLTSIPAAQAPPITVAHLDAVTGYEWAEVSDTVGSSWNDIAAVCDPVCDGVLSDVSVTGWTWADLPDVREVFRNVTGLEGSFNFVRLEGELPSPEGDAMLSAFSPTEVGTITRIRGWTSRVSQSPFGTIYSRMSFFRSPKIDEDGQLQIRDEWLLTGVGGPDAPDRVEPPTGAWLFRVTPAQATKQLIQDVDALDADGSLNRGQAQSLRTTLARALESIADEQPDKAIQALTVFTRQVAGSVLARRLSFDEGQALIAAAQNAIVGLQAG